MANFALDLAIVTVGGADPGDTRYFQEVMAPILSAGPENEDSATGGMTVTRKLA